MTSVDGVLMSKDKKKIIRCPQSKTSFTVPESVTTVGYDAFEDCDINRLIFPEAATIFENGSINVNSEYSEFFFEGHLESFGLMDIPLNSTLYVKSEDDKKMILQNNKQTWLEDNIIVEP